MSNSKKLEYGMEEPAFLRRMRAAASGAGHQERYIAPRNRKTRVDDEEDEPQYVLEDGSQVTKAQFEAMENGEDPEADNATTVDDGDTKDGKEGTKEGGKESNTGDPSVVEAGVKKKRKAVKVIGGDADEEDDEPALKKGKSKEGEDGKKKKTASKSKRKVKLSFDQE